MKKNVLKFITAIALAGISLSVQAALVNGTRLSFNPGITECILGALPDCSFTDYSGTYYTGTTVNTGSWFGMDTNADGSFDGSYEKTALIMNDGLIIGATQDASGAHEGAPDGSENPGIDNPWEFFGNTGMHLTVGPVDVIDDDVNNDGGYIQTLDFSNWGIAYGNATYIPMGGDPDVISDNQFSDGTGIATITCSIADCAIGSDFILTYETTVLSVGSFDGTDYLLHLEGTISAVPLPAAIWLFASGLVGLVAFTRRNKT